MSVASGGTALAPGTAAGRQDEREEAAGSESLLGRRRPYLIVQNLTKSFGGFVALREISLEVIEGELLCFLGPSGCGKTTLLRVVAGLDVQDSGRIEQDGREISALPMSERDFGIVFQSYALFPNLSVRSNIAYGLRGRSRAAIGTRVSELLDLIGMADQGDKYPAQLSGGQQQRVALARALAVSPGLLLLDEPLSALDARVRLRLRHEIRQLQRRLGVTTILVTHDQEEALTLADRVVVMDQGRVQQVGTPIEIYQHPGNPFVADFIGTMSFIDGTVSGPGRVRLGAVEIACEAPLPAAGSDVTVAVRPEDILVGAIRQPARNLLVARVVERDFVGAFWRFVLSVEGLPGRLTLDLPRNAVRDLGLGEQVGVTITLPSDRILVFPR